MGRIYSRHSKQLMSIKIKANGYYQIKLTISTNDENKNSNRTYPLHRLLMSVFKPVENMEELVINHIDGVKTNNSLDNLEWVTYSENTQHAIRTGLWVPKKGDECSYSKITEEQVRTICEMIISCKYTKKEISKILNIPKSTIVDITTGVSWVHITKDYDLKNRDSFRKPKIIELETIHKFCKYFENNPKEENMKTRQYILQSIKDVLNINDNISDNIYYCVRGIYDKKYYKKISGKYNFQ